MDAGAWICSNCVQLLASLNIPTQYTSGARMFQIEGTRHSLAYVYKDGFLLVYGERAVDVTNPNFFDKLLDIAGYHHVIYNN